MLVDNSIFKRLSNSTKLKFIHKKKIQFQFKYSFCYLLICLSTTMTAETLKPFITPTSSENYVPAHSSATAARRHRSCNFLAITASVVAIILTTAVLGITVSICSMLDLQKNCIISKMLSKMTPAIIVRINVH